MSERSRQNNSIRSSGISRRSLLVGASAGAAMLPAVGVRRAWAADSEAVIRIGFVSPRTGNLGFFGQCDGYVLDECRKALASGWKVGDKTYRVEIIDRDSQSDPARAAQLAKGLISNEKVDLMLVTSTPEVVNPVADACEAAGVPCLSTVMPWEAWYFGRGAKPGQPSPFKWTYHFSFGGAQFSGAYISRWKMIPTNMKVGVMYPNDADGNAVRGFLPEAFTKAGFTVIDPGPFEDGTTDYSAQIALFKRERCEIINALVLPPDFATFLRQAAQQGLTKTTKIMEAAKAAGSPVEIEALGALGINVSNVAPWNPAFPYTSPVTKLTSQQMADGYEKASSKQVTMQLGSSMAVFDAGLEAVRSAGNPLDKAALAKAISTLKATTTVGVVDFNTGPMPNVIATTPLVGSQFQKATAGSKFKIAHVICEHSNDPNVPITGEQIVYNG
ncbi:ABC transporter substrate-binding protein [Bradyrhizobium sp. Ec3.3]|uniref:ABC transporter substrate-binding protein n=1 Tax=Bradyrhizobium sp. Ec3.3 TaxID=189753 RepID=UPI0004283458|nr:ABC transporter substrate-binding protein [Bradyrhizobium sp. Ec3.3]